MTTTRLPKTITAGALLATPIPPVKWIIPGLLPAGLAIFAGPSKAGKCSCKSKCYPESVPNGFTFSGPVKVVNQNSILSENLLGVNQI